MPECLRGRNKEDRISKEEGVDQDREIVPIDFPLSPKRGNPKVISMIRVRK